MLGAVTSPSVIISIHALLAESDHLRGNIYLVKLRISIHALLAESDKFLRSTPYSEYISIHALLAESDCIFCAMVRIVSIFLSTLSLRRATRRTAGNR